MADVGAGATEAVGSLNIDIEAVRADFPALETFTWFQNGGVSITPRPVADEHARLMRELLERGPMHIVYPDEEYPRRQRSMHHLAGFFGQYLMGQDTGFPDSTVLEFEELIAAPAGP